MYNFFISPENRQNDTFYIDGKDHNHIKNVLRMKVGEKIFVSVEGDSHLCIITDIGADETAIKMIEEKAQNTELPCEITLFQGLPKSDKMELIIQKAVELGVSEIVPVQMHRSVVKLDDKKKKSKQIRWQAISESAAKQSKRNIIPTVSDVLSFSGALKKAEKLDLFLIPYENKNGMKDTKEALEKIKKGSKIGILIGPEGGFEESEIIEARASKGTAISLGSRILRTETAAIISLSMCMLYCEMNLQENEND